MNDRRPLIVLGVLAVLAVLVFGFGVAGAGRDGGSGWPEWATPDFSPGDPLTVADLSGDSSCSIDGAAIAFSGVCRVEVKPVTGGWPWERATRRALLVVGAGPVDLGVTLAGKALRTDLDPGDDIRLTYTRDGGSFVLACVNPTGCAVTLVKDS
ncbi:MAG: hypothetical protein AAGC63_15565 [Propionicimonas sp.]|nr:hypothetical protein [Propionicimonas sp.]